jgi:energy-coupling factor transporter ATP-binding protein EcfA2
MDGSGRQDRVEGDVVGRLVVGDHNVVVTVDGSIVTPVRPADLPRPVRREHVELLPRKLSAPLGRRKELDAVTRAITNGQPAQVFGADGVGKSTLLRAAAHALAGHGDGVVFLDANGYDIEDLVQCVFEACHDTSGYRPGAAEMRHLLSSIRICLVVDDVSFSAAMLDRLLDAVPAGAVLFTSTERLLWGPGQVVHLRGLSLAKSIALIERVLDRPLPADQQAGAEALWRSTGGNALDLVRVAATASNTDGTVLLPRPNGTFDVVSNLAAGLDSHARAVLALLVGAGRACVSAEVLARLVTVPRPVEAADRLAALGLVNAADRGYRVDAAVAEVLSDDLALDGVELERIAGRLAEWVVSPGVTPADVADHAWLITALVDATTAVGRPSAGTRLARAAAPAAACSLRWGVWGRIVASGRAAAAQAEDREAQAYLAHEDGVRSRLTGNRVAAAAAFAVAAGIWQDLGVTHAVAVTNRAQALAGPSPTLSPAPEEPAQEPDSPGEAMPEPVSVAVVKPRMTLSAKLLIGAVLTATVATGVVLTTVATCPPISSPEPPHESAVTESWK